MFDFSEFLSGFRKRKQERREKAKSDLEKQVKEEKKRIKQEVRMKLLMLSNINTVEPFLFSFVIVFKTSLKNHCQLSWKDE